MDGLPSFSLPAEGKEFIMRRLPIFLVIDVSESMAGNPIENVRKGIHDLTDALMTDPYAMETAYLSVITFAGRARVVTPLTYLLSFTQPELSIGAGTSLSAALDTLMAEIDKNVKKNTPECKGDWRPLVFLLTDGAPNDRYQDAVKRWRQKYDGKISIIAVLMGTDSDASALRSLTESILVFKDTSAESYKAFFKWVSTSIQTSSKAIGETGNQMLPEKLARDMEKDLLAEKLPDKNSVEYFVIPARCSRTGKLYLLRAVRRAPSEEYLFDGAYKVDESYLEMSAVDESYLEISVQDGEAGLLVPASQIYGSLPPCPWCGNPGHGQARCGKFHCIPANAGAVKCPWCGDVDAFGGPLKSIHGGRD